MRRLLYCWLAVSGLLLVASPAAIHAGVVVYEYSGVLDSPLGSNPVGTPFSGQFAYDTPQAGTTTPFFGGTQTVFGYSVLTLTIGGQTVTDGPGALTLYDNVTPPNGVPVGDSLYTFLPPSGTGPAPSTGSFPGVTPNSIYLGLPDPSGTVISGPSLPTNLSLSSFFEPFVGVNYGPLGAGDTTVVFPLLSLGQTPASVPEPMSICLLTAGLFAGAVGMGVRRMTGPGRTTAG
jgi:hypothetical protein